MNVLKPLFAILFISFVLFSCEEKEPHEDMELPGAFVATVDGETIDFSYKPRATVATSNEYDALYIEGVTSDFTKELNIEIINMWEVGTYTLGSYPNNYAYFSSSPLGGGLLTTYGAIEGEVLVTSYTGSLIKGSFHFEAINGYNAKDTITIAGTFDLKVYE